MAESVGVAKFALFVMGQRASGHELFLQKVIVDDLGVDKICGGETPGFIGRLGRFRVLNGRGR
jgi:hypothetical protein